ncbi:MAG: pentapeptide repeat-containing protein [Desulfomonile tiedjei]|nr:pentapeptide repeat-containing protein [Desulfomonile tiedjei]
MSQRETVVKAIEALNAIRSGLSDHELMEKFTLSANALQSLFKQLLASGLLHESELRNRAGLDSTVFDLGMGRAEHADGRSKKPVIDAADALQCIRSGLSDAALMKRYDISSRGVQSLFNKLVSSGAMPWEELEERNKKVHQTAHEAPIAAEGTREDTSQGGSDASAAATAAKSGVDAPELPEQRHQPAESLEAILKEVPLTGPTESAAGARDAAESNGSVILAVHSAGYAAGRPKKPVIDATDVLTSLRSGMDDAALMKRYNLSARGLQSLFNKLAGTGAILQAELDDRAARSNGAVFVDEEVSSGHLFEISRTDVDPCQIVVAVKSGASFEAIMEQCKLTSRTLKEQLKRLHAQGLICQDELDSSALGRPTGFEIRDRLTDKVIFSGEEASLGALVEKAVAARVNLANADLSGANLSRRDLSGALLARVDLKKAILVGTDLTGADLSDTILKSADLYGAVLRKANLARADLSDANLAQVQAMWAFMPEVKLSEANLTQANLTGANLANADLFEAILTRTDLTGAYVQGVNFDQARGRHHES